MFYAASSCFKITLLRDHVTVSTTSIRRSSILLNVSMRTARSLHRSNARYCTTWLLSSVLKNLFILFSFHRLFYLTCLTRSFCYCCYRLIGFGILLSLSGDFGHPAQSSQCIFFLSLVPYVMCYSRMYNMIINIKVR